jgi:hypothetical protein
MMNLFSWRKSLVVAINLSEDMQCKAVETGETNAPKASIAQK